MYKQDHIKVLKVLASYLPAKKTFTTKEIVELGFKRAENADRRVRNAYRKIRKDGHAEITDRGAYRLTAAGASFCADAAKVNWKFKAEDKKATTKKAATKKATTKKTSTKKATAKKEAAPKKAKKVTASKAAPKKEAKKVTASKAPKATKKEAKKEAAPKAPKAPKAAKKEAAPKAPKAPKEAKKSNGKKTVTKSQVESSGSNGVNTAAVKEDSTGAQLSF